MLDLYADVTARIIAQLEQGAAPWVRPWSLDGAGYPRNGLTGRQYAGNNVLLLWIAGTGGGFEAQEWYTFDQACQAVGLQKDERNRWVPQPAKGVRKGSKGTRVMYRGPAGGQRDTESSDDDQPAAGRPRRAPRVFRTYVVFNRAQIDGLPEQRRSDGGPLHYRIAAAERFIRATGANITEAGGRAAYYPATDGILLPPLQAFDNVQAYYAAAFHELTHWSGASHRLRRLRSTENGTAEYAQEELTAELGAAYLCAYFGIDGYVQHPEYLAMYGEHLADVENAFFRAAAASREAVDYLLGLTGHTSAAEAA